MKIALCLGLLMLAVSGCATHQTLPHAVISGKVVDRQSRTPIAGARVAFIYWGPTRDMPAPKGESQFVPSIDAGYVLTDSAGHFSAVIPERKVRRPLIDAWSSHPDIEVSMIGYRKVSVSELSILPVYHQPEGPPRFTEWPYTDDFVVELSPEANSFRSEVRQK